jgi:hypothetical protein
MRRIYILTTFICCSVFCFGQKDTGANGGYKPKPIDYNASIQKGDLAFSGKDYLLAKLFYKDAATAKPAEAYPKDQIAKCDGKMSSDSWMSTELNCPCGGGKIPKSTTAKSTDPVTTVNIVSTDTAVYSVFPGKVSSVSTDTGFHTIVLIKHGKYIATYSNLAGSHLMPGDEVKEGDVVGYFKKSKNPYTLTFAIWTGKEKEDPKKYLRCKKEQ